MNKPIGKQSNSEMRITLVIRIVFSLVFLLNIQCALQFILTPHSFMGAYELSGTAGKVALQGIGVAFLMWNATYPPYIFKPAKYPLLGGVIIAQQLIGLIGETYILFSLPSGHTLLCESIQRFICFDAAGLILMCIAFTIFFFINRKENDSCLPSGKQES